MAFILLMMLFLVNSAYSFSGDLQGILTCKAAYQEVFSGIDVIGCYTGMWSKSYVTINDYFLYNHPDNEIISVFYDERSNRFFIYYK